MKMRLKEEVHCVFMSRKENELEKKKAPDQNDDEGSDTVAFKYFRFLPDPCPHKVQRCISANTDTVSGSVTLE